MAGLLLVTGLGLGLAVHVGKLQ